MPDPVPPGTIRTETDGRIFRIVVDNAAKRNAAGTTCTLPLPTFSSQQADHGIAKIAPARYFHGSARP